MRSFSGSSQTWARNDHGTSEMVRERGLQANGHIRAKQREMFITGQGEPMACHGSVMQDFPGRSQDLCCRISLMGKFKASFLSLCCNSLPLTWNLY